MKPTTIVCFVALILSAISCTKESTTIQSSGITVESSTSDDMTGINALSVKIGSQIWMNKNLNVTKYRNGDPIPEVRNKAKWATLTTGAWCWLNNDSANSIYGRLYNAYAVNDPRGLAPAGWHISSDSEWATLTTFLGGEGVAGGKMKSTGTIEAGTGLWYAPNLNATNISGFTGLPGGYRNYTGTFYDIGYNGDWWSSESSTSYAWYRSLTDGTGIIYRDSYYEQSGFSVRCVRD